MARQGFGSDLTANLVLHWWIVLGTYLSYFTTQSHQEVFLHFTTMRHHIIIMLKKPIQQIWNIYVTLKNKSSLLILCFYEKSLISMTSFKCTKALKLIKTLFRLNVLYTKHVSFEKSWLNSFLSYQAWFFNGIAVESPLETFMFNNIWVYETLHAVSRQMYLK